MQCRDFRYASVPPTATMKRVAYPLHSLGLHLHRVARQALQHWRKRHSRRWYATWPQRPVRRTPMELVALLLVVSEHGAQTVGAGADEHGKAMARQQPGENDSAHVRGCSWGVRMFPGAQCRKVATVTVTVITAGDGMTRGKEEMMTRSLGQPF
jgi:hypothetical protein